MAYKVIISKSAAKSLSKLPKSIQLRISGAIDLLAENPYPPATKKLTGRDGFRIKTSDYRIIYTIENNVMTVCVIAIGHRRDIYRK